MAAVTAVAPTDIPAFIARIQQLEQLGVSAKADVAFNRQVNIPSPQKPDLTIAFKEFGDKLVAELANKLVRLTVGKSEGRGHVGPPVAARRPMECLLCHNMGHKARYCPTRSENTGAGH